MEDCIHSTGLENLDFITAGPTLLILQNLLLSDSFKSIVEELKIFTMM